MVRLTAQPTAPSPAAPGSPPTAQAAQQRWDQLSQALSPDGLDAPSPAVASGLTAASAASAKLRAQDDVIQCPDCTKPILESAMADHAVNCQKIRERSAAGGTQMKRRLSSVSTDSPSKKPRPTSLVLVLGEGGTGSSSEEAPLSATAGVANKKKLVIKDGAERKSRTNGPVDLDRHCGVPVPNPAAPGSTMPCSRSLTCKSHSLTLKRQVPHRSKPFDVLLSEWQRVNRPQATAGTPGTRGSGVLEAAGSSSQLIGEADTEKGRKKEKKKKRQAAQAAAVAAAQASAAGGIDLSSLADQRRGKKGLQIVGEWSDDEALPGGEDDLIDSEEEVESVLRGLARSQSSGAGAGTASWGRPLAGLTHGGGAGLSGASLFVGRNVKLARLREALGGLFGSLS